MELLLLCGELLQKALHIKEAMDEVTEGDWREALVVGAQGFARGWLGADACLGNQGWASGVQGAGSIPSWRISSAVRAISASVASALPGRCTWAGSAALACARQEERSVVEVMVVRVMAAVAKQQMEPKLPCVRCQLCRRPPT